MKKVIGFGLALAPFMTFAAAVNNLSDVISVAGSLINSVVPLLFAIAVVYLLWSIVKFIEAGSGDPKTRDAARDAIVLAVILLFVMTSIWGLVGVLKGSFTFGTAVDVKSGEIAPFK
jgi:heme/copper-type cytochrome/quinol oxidase subunit 4